MNSSLLSIFARLSILLGFVCAIIILIDILNGHQQQMMIMNFVYPITALYAGPIALLFYFFVGRKSSKKHKQRNTHSSAKEKPMWQTVAKGAMHCGSGCTLGDIIAESILLAAPLTLFGMKLFGAWAVDYVAALVIGIIFQYFSIKPMRNLSAREALKAAFKADVLSLTSWQFGMYGWMAISTFLIFHRELKADTATFWFMMQIAMMLGFITAYPVNWWLIKKGIKEKM